jgi:glutamyl-tRNA synthetase
VEYQVDAVDRHLGAPDLAGHIEALVKALSSCDPFDEASIEAAVRAVAAERGIKAGPLIHATRVAIIGRTTSPGLFEMLALLGREESVARLNALRRFLAAHGSRV